PNVVDEDVQPSLLRMDPIEKGRHLLLDGVVDLHRDADAAVGCDHLRRLFDSLGAALQLEGGVRASIICSRPITWLYCPAGPVPTGTAPCAVHRSTGLSQHAGDPTPGAPGRTDNDGNLSSQTRHKGLPSRIVQYYLRRRFMVKLFYGVEFVNCFLEGAP